MQYKINDADFKKDQYVNALHKLEHKEILKSIQQLMVDVMDITEQSPTEVIIIEIEKLLDKYIKANKD